MHSISTSHRVATAVFFATAMCSFATQAQAGGLFVPLGGVATSGRAGAAVVSTRDPNAIAYNPALIALNEGHQILVDATWAMLNLEYQRSPQVEPNGTTTTFQKVKNEAVGIVIPQILFTTDFGTDQFGLGVGLFPPNAAPAKFPATGAQRYAIIDMSVTNQLLLLHTYKYQGKKSNSQ